MTIATVVGICLITLLLLLAWWVISLIYGKRIEINFSRERMYGWYDMDILCSSSFSGDMTSEEINKIKEDLSKELEKQIIKYKQVKK